jgi:hypothetical protein
MSGMGSFYRAADGVGLHRIRMRVAPIVLDFPFAPLREGHRDEKPALNTHARNFSSEQFSKNLLASAPLRCADGQLNHQKHRVVSTGTCIRSRARRNGKMRIRHLLDRGLADRLLMVPWLLSERPRDLAPALAYL